ncbi:MAG: hypothetical protein HUU03_12300 [Planctomycetaceae bacterium]|nr:hypothetical protein [Planctomycetaceae bacterium]
MTQSALLYLVARTTFNSVKHRLARLKQPRYLLPTVAGLAYFWFVFGMPGLGRGTRAPEVADFAPTIRALAGAGLLFFTVTGWILAPNHATLMMSEAEVMQLCTSPLTRAQIIRYRWLRAQPATLFMALVAGVLALKREELNAIFAALGTWLIVNVMFLNGIAAALFAGKLKSLGVRGLSLRIPGIMLALAVAAAFAPNFTPPPSLRQFREIPDWLSHLFNDGLAGALLWPLRQLAQMPAATDWPEFAVGAGVALAMMLGFDQLATRLNTPFEESALDLAQNVGRRLEAFRRGGMSSMKLAQIQTVKPSRLRLAEQGPVWRAMLWKALVGQTRGVSARLLFPLLGLAILFGVIVFSSDRPEVVDVMVISTFSVLTIMLVIAGPQMLRNDLRSELHRLDYLKSLPLRGRDILRGEVYGSALLVGAALVGIVTTAMLLIRTAEGLHAAWRITIIATSASFLPPVAAMSFAIENGAAVLMPSWVAQAPGSGGVELMGRNMLMAFLRLILLSLLLAIPGSAAAVLVAVGVLVAPSGLAAAMALVFAGGVAGGLLTLLEVEVLLRFFGRRFETLDPSLENM